MLIFIPIINSYFEWIEHANYLGSTRVPGIKTVSVYSKDSNKSLEFYLDERINTIKVKDTFEKKFKNLIFKEIHKHYNLMKSSDVSYGNIDTDSYIEYDPTKNIYIEDFIEFLKQENRNQIIDLIIK
jgi:hypothetical protein